MLTNQQMMDIMDQYSPYLIQLSYMYIKDWSAAEDIVQETFISYFSKPNNFEQNASLKTYLSRITINKSIDYTRSLKTRAKTFLNLIQGTSHTTLGSDELLLERINRSEIYRHVLTLKVKYREVIVLYYYENFSTKEIAAILSLPEATIRTRLKRGREQLKEVLFDENMEVFQYE